MPAAALAIDLDAPAVTGASPRRPHLRLIHASPSRTPGVILKQAEAVRMKLSGATYEQVAAALGYGSRSGAHAAVRAGLAEAVRASGVLELRQLECERLERLHASRWEAAIGGDDAAVDLILRLMKRRAALMGLDAPARVQAAPAAPPFVVVRRVRELAVLSRLGGLSDAALAEVADLCERLASSGDGAGG